MHTPRIEIRDGGPRQPNLGRPVLVTGGAGFIGAHLTVALLRSGHQVTVVDDYSTGDPARLRAVEGHPQLRVIQADIGEPIPVAGDVGQIYHLAAPAAPTRYQADPIGTIRTCVQGTGNVLDLATSEGASVVFSSTSEVYGDPDIVPQPETYTGNVNPIGLRSPYDEGKRCAEALCFAYARQHGVDIKVARLFNTYGPGMSLDGRVMATFIWQALHGWPLTIHGRGQQRRAFCFVEDTVDALMRLMRTPAGVNGPINIGHPSSITVLDLAARVSAAVGVPLHTLFKARPSDDPGHREPDIQLARDLLRWEPTVDLDAGLALTVADLRARASDLSRAPGPGPMYR